MLRQNYRLTGRVGVLKPVDVMDPQVDLLPLGAQMHEITVKRSIAVSTELDYARQRWAIAHGIGHRILHPGNAVWAQAHTAVAIPFEREAEGFAYGLLVDAAALDERPWTLVEVAEHFGIPMHTLWENAPQTWRQFALWRPKGAEISLHLADRTRR